MRIMYDYQIFSTQVYGGISRYFVELCQEAGKIHGHEVDILSPIYFNQYLKSLAKELKSGIYIKRLPMTGKLVRTYNKRATNTWVKAHKPDIVHATYYYPFSARVDMNGKKVVTVHDMIHEKYSEMAPLGDQTAELKSKAVQNADHVICVSNTTRNDLIDILGINPDKTSTVYHGFRPFPGDGKELKPEIDSPYLLYIGVRNGYKNFRTFLKAYAASYQLNSHFSLVCFGGGAFNRNELELINDLKIDEKQVSQKDGNDETLAAFYKNAQAFIYPSLYEGFGIPPLEAMSQACPVICSSGGSIPEIVGDAAEFFDPKCLEDIIHTIENVVFDVKRLDTLKNLGNQQFKKYTWSRCAQETLRIYQSVL